MSKEISTRKRVPLSEFPRRHYFRISKSSKSVYLLIEIEHHSDGSVYYVAERVYPDLSTSELRYVFSSNRMVYPVVYLPCDEDGFAVCEFVNISI